MDLQYYLDIFMEEHYYMYVVGGIAAFIGILSGPARLKKVGTKRIELLARDFRPYISPGDYNPPSHFLFGDKYRGC